MSIVYFRILLDSCLYLRQLLEQGLTNNYFSKYLWRERMNEMSEFLSNEADYIHPKEFPEKSLE